MLPDDKYRCPRCNLLNDVGRHCKRCFPPMRPDPMKPMQSAIAIAALLCIAGMYYFFTMQTSVPMYPVSDDMLQYVPYIYKEELGNRKIAGILGCGLGLFACVGGLLYFKKPS